MRDPRWTRLAFDGAVLAALALGSLWLTRREPDPASVGGRPISFVAAGAWSVAALLTVASTSLWLSRGMLLDLG